MGGVPVTIVDSGGVPVIDVDGAEPVTKADNAMPVTLVETGGVPVTFVTAALARDPQNDLDAQLDAQMAALSLYAWLDPATLPTGYISTAGTGSKAGESDPVGYRADRSGSGHHGIAPANDRRPTLDVTGGVASDQFDGVNDALVITPTATFPSDCSVFVAVRSIDTQFVVLGSHYQHTNYLAAAHDGGHGVDLWGGVGSNVILTIDGAAFVGTDRDNLHTALADGQWHVMEASRVDLSIWTALNIGDYHPLWPFAGNIGPVIIIETSALTDDIRNRIILPWFAQRLGIELLDVEMAKLPLSMWLDPADRSTGFIARNGTGANAGQGDPVGYRADRSGNGLHAVAINDDVRPFLDITAGVVSELQPTEGDRLHITPVGSFPSDCSVFVAVNTTDPRAVLIGAGSDHTRWMLYAQDGHTSTTINLNAGSNATIAVDGSAFTGTTRDEFHDAVVDGHWHIVELARADLSAWPALSPGYFQSGGYQLIGNIGPVVMIETWALTDDIRNRIILPWFRQRIETLDQKMTGLPLALWLDPATQSTGIVARDGTGAAAGAGQAVGYRADRSGNGLHAIAWADDQRPILDVTSDVVSDGYDGVNDNLSVALSPSAPSNARVILGLKTTDAQGAILISTALSPHWFGVWEDGSSITSWKTGSGAIGPSSIMIDGTTFAGATRDDLHTALADGGWHVVELAEMDLSAMADLTVGRGHGGVRTAGHYGPIAVIAESDLTDHLRNHVILPWFRERLGIATLDGRMANLPLAVWLDPATPSTGFVARDGTGALAATGQAVGYRVDRSGNDHHGIAPADDRRPILDVTSGVTSDVLDGVNDTLRITPTTTFPSDCSVFIAIKTVDTGFMVLGDSLDGNRYMLFALNSTGVLYDGVGSPTVAIDGTTFSGSRTELLALLADGNWHIAELANVDISTWPRIDIGSNNNFRLDGNVGPLVIIETSALTDDIRTEIILPWFNERLGLS